MLAQLQVVQNEPVAVVGYAQAVRGLAVGGGGKVGAASRGPVYAPSATTPSSACPARRQPSRGSGPVRGQKAVGQAANLVDGEPGVALQVQGLSQVDLEVAVRAGHPLAAVHVDRRHSFL